MSAARTLMRRYAANPCKNHVGKPLIYIIVILQRQDLTLKMALKNKGQIAIEYMLMIVVAIGVIVAVYYFVTGTASTAKNETFRNFASGAAYAECSGSFSGSKLTINPASCKPSIDPSTRPVTTSMWVQSKDGTFDIIAIESSNNLLITIDGRMPATDFIKIYESRPVMVTHMEQVGSECRPMPGFGTDLC